MNEDNGKGYGCFVMLVSGVAIIFSVAALLRHDNWDCEISPAGFVIATLSALITFVVAWQIWQTIASREVEKATKAADTIEEIRAKLNCTNEIAEGHAWRGEANLLYKSEREGLTAFHAYIEAAYHYILGQADYTRHIDLVFNRIRDVVNFGTASLGRQHWVITHEREVDNDIDKLAAAISTMEGQLAEARGRLSEIRMLIRTIRQIQ